MKVYLDDERDTPEGWVRVYWPDESTRLLIHDRCPSPDVASVSKEFSLVAANSRTNTDIALNKFF